MTEKRFTVIDKEEPRKQSVAEKGIPCSARHCCTRLNRLTEENEQLKQDGFYWSQTAEARRKEIDKLRKDNNILKQQRDYLFDVIDEVLPHSGSTTAYNRMKDIGADGND